MTTDPEGYSGAEFLIRLGIRAFYQGHLHQALDIFQEALVVAQLEADSLLELWAIEWVGVTFGNLGRRDDQFKMAMRLYNHAQELGEPRYRIQGNMRLAEVMGAMDTRRNWETIRPLLTEGIDLARQAGASYEEIYQTALLAIYAAEVREYDLARDVARRGLSLVASYMTSRHYFYFRLYATLARVACELELAEEAIRYAERSVESARASTSPAYAATAEITLGRALAIAGRHEEAQELIGPALERANTRGWRPIALHGYATQAEALRRAGRYAESVRAVRKAIDLAGELSSPEDQVHCLVEMGRAYQAMGELEQARGAWEQAAALSRERGYADYLAISRDLLDSLNSQPR